MVTHITHLEARLAALETAHLRLRGEPRSAEREAGAPPGRAQAQALARLRPPTRPETAPVG